MFNHLKSIISKYLGTMGRKIIWKHFFQSTMQKRSIVAHKHLNCHIYSSQRSWLLLENYLAKKSQISEYTVKNITECLLFTYLWRAWDNHSCSQIPQSTGLSILTTGIVSDKRSNKLQQQTCCLPWSQDGSRESEGGWRWLLGMVSTEQPLIEA